MTLSRVSTLGVHTRTMRDISNLNSNITDLQKQISSEEAVDSYTDLGLKGDIERLVNFGNSLVKNQDYIKNNDITLSRIRQMDLSLERVLDVASKFRDSLTSRRSPTGPSMQFGTLATSYLQTVQDNLNSNYAGRFVFSGSKINTVAALDIVKNSNVINGEVTNNYYQGDNFIQGIQASANLYLEYGVNADDKAFQNLIAAIHIAKEASDANDDEGLAKAMDLANAAIYGLVDLRSVANNNIHIISTTNEGNTKVNIYLNEILSDELKTDVAFATLELSANEATLRAIYMTFSRLSRLNLTEFL